MPAAARLISCDGNTASRLPPVTKGIHGDAAAAAADADSGMLVRDAERLLRILMVMCQQATGPAQEATRPAHLHGISVSTPQTRDIQPVLG